MSKLRSAKISCILACIAVILSAVNLLIRVIGGMPIGTSIAIFCSMIAFLCCMMANVKKQKNV